MSGNVLDITGNFSGVVWVCEVAAMVAVMLTETYGKYQ